MGRTAGASEGGQKRITIRTETRDSSPTYLDCQENMLID